MILDQALQEDPVRIKYYQKKMNTLEKIQKIVNMKTKVIMKNLMKIKINQRHLFI